jgi:hypothetical protein
LKHLSSIRRLGVVSALALSSIAMSLAGSSHLPAAAAVNPDVAVNSVGEPCGKLPLTADPAQNASACAGELLGSDYVTQDPNNSGNRAVGLSNYWQGILKSAVGYGSCISDTGGPPDANSGTLAPLTVADTAAAFAYQLVMMRSTDGRFIWSPADGTALTLNQRGVIASAMAHIARHDLAAGGSGLQTVYASLLGNTTLGTTNFRGAHAYASIYGKELYDLANAHPGPWSITTSGAGAVLAGQSWSGTATIVDVNGNPVPRILIDIDWSGAVSGSVSSPNGSVSFTTAPAPASGGSVSFNVTSARPDPTSIIVTGMAKSNVFGNNAAQDLLLLTNPLPLTGSLAGTAPAATAPVAFAKVVSGGVAGAGFVFTIAGTDVVYNSSVTTDASGLVAAITLGNGNYTMTETAVPVGSTALLNPTPVPFTVTNGVLSGPTVASGYVVFTDLLTPLGATQVDASDVTVVDTAIAATYGDTYVIHGSPNTAVGYSLRPFWGTGAHTCTAASAAGPVQSGVVTLDASGNATVHVTLTAVAPSGTTELYWQEGMTQGPYTSPVGCGLATEITAIWFPVGITHVDASSLVIADPTMARVYGDTYVITGGKPGSTVTYNLRPFWGTGAHTCTVASAAGPVQSGVVTLDASGYATVHVAVSATAPSGTTELYWQESLTVAGLTSPVGCGLVNEITSITGITIVTHVVQSDVTVLEGTTPLTFSDTVTLTGKPGSTVSYSLQPFWTADNTVHDCAVANAIHDPLTGDVVIGADGTATVTVTFDATVPQTTTAVYWAETASQSGQGTPYACGEATEITTVYVPQFVTVAQPVTGAHFSGDTVTLVDTFSGAGAKPGSTLQVAITPHRGSAAVALTCADPLVTATQFVTVTVSESGTFSGSASFPFTIPAAGDYLIHFGEGYATNSVSSSTEVCSRPNESLTFSAGKGGGTTEEPPTTA